MSAKTTEMVETPVQTHLYLLSALGRDGSVLDHLAEQLKKHDVVIKKTEDLGMKKLAYPINKQTDLNLVSIFFEAPGATAYALENQLRHEEEVERFLLTRWNASLEASNRTSRMKDKEKEAAQEKAE
jgi:small subunit ribosomal protein S6